MNQHYFEWREKEIKRIGLAEQLKAEAVLEKHDKQEFRTIQEESTGNLVAYKESVAQAKLSKRTHRVPTKVFSVPPMDWLK